MIVEPLKDIVQLEIEEATAGVLDTSGRSGAVEYATVKAVGHMIGSGVYLNVGDKVFVKSWAIDIVTHEDKKFYFVNVNSKGILAVVK